MGAAKTTAAASMLTLTIQNTNHLWQHKCAITSMHWVVPHLRGHTVKHKIPQKTMPFTCALSSKMVHTFPTCPAAPYAASWPAVGTPFVTTQ
jgi:hypothetical protein